MRYLANTTLRFRSGKGERQEIPEGSVVSFEDGDKVNIGFLLLIGAIQVHEEPIEQPIEQPTRGMKHGRKAR